VISTTSDYCHYYSSIQNENPTLPADEDDLPLEVPPSQLSAYLNLLHCFDFYQIGLSRFNYYFMQLESATIRLAKPFSEIAVVKQAL
jgi:hypothetical protein